MAFITQNRRKKKIMNFKSINLVSLVLVLAVINGCASGPTLYTSAQNTPIAHSENKVLFVDLLQEGEPTTSKKVDLRHGYQLEYLGPNDTLQKVNNKIPYKDVIQKNDAFSIILNAVWVPELPNRSIFGRSGSDIAVILDIIAEDGETKPIVVAYQRDVRGKHLLNFKNIVVYNTENWDGIHQPYFHLRIMDVSSERNKNTQELLDAASSSVNSLAGIVPSAYFPHIAQAIKTSKFILGGKKNKILLDYKIQFFNLSTTDAQSGDTQSVNQVLDRFAQGKWIAVGRPSERDPDFWDADFSYNRKSAQIERLKLSSMSSLPPSVEVLDVPYVSMVVVKRDYGISKSILKSFNRLAQLILNGESKNNSEGIRQVSTSLQQYASELEEIEKIADDLTAIGIATTNHAVKIKSLTNIVNRYINTIEYFEQRSLRNSVIENYGVPIQQLITLGSDGTEIPDPKQIESVVTGK